MKEGIERISALPLGLETAFDPYLMNKELK